MPKKYHSKILAVIHETVADLNRGVPMDIKTMRKFDALCLTPVQEMSPRKIRALRTREKASQTVFAAYLNVTPGLISKWERGEKHPRGASLKLLTLVDKKGLDVVA
jgi:putative transcriptional regulator